MNPLGPTPAARATAEAVARHFGEAKAAEHEVELGGRQMLEAAYRCGKALLAARAAVAPGGWLAALDKHMPGKRRTAQNYMRIAENWREVKDAATLREALAWLTTPSEEPEEKPADAKRVSPDLLTNEADEEEPVGHPTPSPGGGYIAQQREYLEAALRKLKGFQEAISEAYACREGKAALRKAAHLNAALAIQPTADQVEHGRVVVNGAEVVVGPHRVTNHALDDLLKLIGNAKLELARMEEE